MKSVNGIFFSQSEELTFDQEKSKYMNENYFQMILLDKKYLYDI